MENLVDRTVEWLKKKGLRYDDGSVSDLTTILGDFEALINELEHLIIF